MRVIGTSPESLDERPVALRLEHLAHILTDEKEQILLGNWATEVIRDAYREIALRNNPQPVGSFEHLSLWKAVSRGGIRGSQYVGPIDARLAFKDVVAILELFERSSTTDGDARSSPAPPQRLRKSGLELSKERLALLEQLTQELTTVYQQKVKQHSLSEMKRRYPKFELWKILPDVEQKELFDEDFSPKHFARQLVMRRYGLRSEETLKKDRYKIKAGSNR